MVKKFKEKFMKIIYAQEPIEIEGDSVFLAGPSPRHGNGKRWRPEAIQLFEKLGFKGTLLIPEFETAPIGDFHYDEQIDWEEEAMEEADIVLFWIPRNLKTLPGFTTNIEFGYWYGRDYGKIRIGFPFNAENMRYIKAKCEGAGIICETKLKTLIKKTVNELKGE